MWHVGGWRNEYNILIWKPEVNRMLLGRHRHRWENNVKLHLKNGWDWTSCFRIVAVCGNDPSGSIK
jgi:hypothetical protein